MRQAIVTKYLGPTDHRGSRVSARAAAGRFTIPWDSALDTPANHRKAARGLADRFGWLDLNDLVGGSLPDSSGYAFVLVPRS